MESDSVEALEHHFDVDLVSKSSNFPIKKTLAKFKVTELGLIFCLRWQELTSTICICFPFLCNTVFCNFSVTLSGKEMHSFALYELNVPSFSGSSGL
jgi:hypothetical protein